jgi:predicted RNA-binding protein YlqC (UPF0109 family)
MRNTLQVGNSPNRKLRFMIDRATARNLELVIEMDKLHEIISKQGRIITSLKKKLSGES